MAPNEVGHHHPVGPCPQEFFFRGLLIGPGQDKEFGVQTPGRHGDEQVICV